MAKDPVQTLVVDNFTGSMTAVVNGPMNSGESYWLDVNGYDPFTKPRNLTWSETPVQIDPTGAVITDLVMASKPRAEANNIVYVYAIGHTGRLYKIQVNDPTTYNPDYDNPVLLTTLTSGSPTFTRGAFIDFFGTTERIYIGHDKGVTRIDFDGANETAISGTWTQTVPRPLKQFIGKLYAGNGTNIAEIDASGVALFSTKLSPGFPAGSQVRDIKLTPDGNYLFMVVTRLALGNLTSTSADTSVLLPTDSYTFIWNGIDTGYTSSNTYPNTILTAGSLFGQYQYTFGYDPVSAAQYTIGGEKLLTSLPDVIGDSALPNAIFTFANLLFWAGTLSFEGNQYLLFQTYGTLASVGMGENRPGFWSPIFHPATSPETDIVKVPTLTLVSNLARGPSYSGYAGNIIGTPKVYYSTLEASNAPTTKYRFYKWSLFPTGLGTPVSGGVSGIYQTQNQLFSKRISVKEVRVYAQPWVAGNAFQVDMIGSDDQPISGGTKLFTEGTDITAGEDFAWYNPAMEPVYSLALRISNMGTTNHVINKVEIDITPGGE